MRLAAPPARPRCAKRSIDRDAAPCTAGSAAPPLPRRRGAATAATRRALLAAPLAAGVAAAAGPTLATAAAAAAPAVERGPLFPGSDIEISRVVKGCWQLGGGHGGERASDRTAGSAAVADFAAFARQGVTTLDTADIYGASEGLVGKYLASSAEARAATQVLTKSCYFGAAMDRARDGAFVRGSVAASAKRLGLGALDLVQFYWHDYENQNLIGAGLHLAELAAAGKVRALGATNFDTARLAALVDAGVPINVHQTQYSLLDTRPDNGMAAYCLANGISLLPYGTVAGGFLSDKYLGVKAEDVSLDTYSKSKYASVINQRGGWDFLQRLLAALAAVGARHGVGAAEVASRWVLQRPAVAGVILGARNAEHAAQHRLLFGFELDAEDLGAIQAALDTGRAPTSDVYTWERGGKWA